MGRLLTLLMAVLMVASCFVALPASAADATSGKTVLWGYDFASFGTQNNTSLKGNYFSANDVFVMDVSGTGATGLSGGMLTIGGATYIRNTKTTGSDPNSDFYDLLFGHYEGYNKVKSNFFMEMDFVQAKVISAKSDTACSWSYYNENDERIEGSGTLYTNDCGASGALVFQFKNGGQGRPLFRITADGLMYTRDNEGGYADALANGSVYYLDGSGNKVYLPANASVNDLNLGYCLKDPSKAYQLEVGVTYRLGFAIRVAGIDSAGKVTLVADVYIKKAGASNWETKVGSTMYYYYPIGANANATAANEYIQLNDSSYIVKLGGVWEIYANTCNGTDHLNVLASSADPLDDTLRACTCIDCGKTWEEREVDGLRYRSVSYGTACEGMYKVWVPLDGVGAPFADSEYSQLGVGHKYSTTTGKCSVCGEYSFLEGFEGSDLRIECGTKEDAKPSYNAEEKSWSWPGGGYMMIKNSMLDGTSMKPYVYSFDVKLDGAVLKNASSTGAWPLMTWQNNGDAGDYQTAYLFIGATGDTEEDDLFLSINYHKNDGSGKKVAGEAVHVFERGQWYNIAIALNPATAAFSVYVDGKYVGAVQNAGYTPNTTYTASTIRMGVNTVTGRYYMQYNLRNIKLEKAASDTYYDIVPNNELFSLRYDRYQLGSAMSEKSTHFLGTFTSAGTFEATAIKTMADGTVFGMVENTNYKQVSLYSNTPYNKYSLSDKKYEIKMSFAVPDTATLPANGANLIRLSKHLDTIRSENLKYSGTGQYMAYVAGVNSNSLLYKKDGVTPLTFVRTFTDGIPESLSEVRMIIDEGKNTYSVYVDNELAYYLDKNGTPQPAKDLTMHLSSGTITGKTYGQITREDIVAAGYTISENGLYDCHYARVLRSIPAVALEEITVTRIPDSDIEWIGVQERIDSANNLFDVRFITALDDVYVPGIGFHIEAFVNGEARGTEDVIVDYAYESIQAGNGYVHSYDFTEGAYLTAFRVVGIDLTNRASDIYTFKITSYVTDEDGEQVGEGVTHTVKYNGQGVCLDSGKPKTFDPKDFESLTTSPVILELKQKAASAAGDYTDFFVYIQCADPSGRYYVRYRFKYAYSTDTTNNTDSATNIESFRVVSAELVKLSSISATSLFYTKIHDLLSSGEISLAIKEYEYGQVVSKGEPQYEDDGVTPVMGNSIQDFCGGFHGDEHFVVVDGVDQFSLKADDVVYTPGAANAIVQCNKIVIDQTTLVDRWGLPAGTNGQFVKHEQTFTLTDDGMQIDRKVTWLVDDFNVDTAYPMMFTLLRVDGGQPICEIVETFDANGVLLGKETLALENSKQQSLLSNASLREAHFSSATSGISAVAKLSLGENNQGVLGSPYVAYRVYPGAGDNKLYIPMTSPNKVQVQISEDGATKTRSCPSLGEVWEISTFYNIDYVNPNN